MNELPFQSECRIKFQIERIFKKNISKAILTKKDPPSDLVDENLITQGRIDC